MAGKLPLSQPSLQELSEKEALSRILQSDSAFPDIMLLDPRLQQILFGVLRIEIVRLREVENSLCRLTKFCPRTDTRIYMKSTRSESDGGENEDNGYNQKEMFRDKWSYLSEDDNDSENGDAGSGRAAANGDEVFPNMRWDSWDLVCE